MKSDDFKIAWRNLWRNKRRTIITSASVFFAVFFAVIMRSVQLGSYDRMIMNFIESYSGYLQVQHVKYQDNPSIDYSFEFSDSLEKNISGVEDVVSVAPHIESFVLASSGTQTKGVAVLAIDPEKERRFSNPENKLVKYRISAEAIASLKKSSNNPCSQYLKELKRLRVHPIPHGQGLNLNLDSLLMRSISIWMRSLSHVRFQTDFLIKDDEGVLVSDRLAGYLKVAIGDTVILMGQGYHGASAAGIFPVRGIIKMPVAEIDSKLIIMTIPAAQDFFDVKGRITSLSVNLTGKSQPHYERRSEENQSSSYR